MIMYNVAQVAEKLSISYYQVSNLIKSNQLTAVSVGSGTRKFWRVSEEALKTFRKSLEQPSTNGASAHSPMTTAPATAPSVPDGYLSLGEFRKKYPLAGKNDGSIYARIHNGRYESKKIDGKFYILDPQTSDGFPATKKREVVTAPVQTSSVPVNVSGIEKRFQVVDQRLKSIEERLEQVITALGGI